MGVSTSRTSPRLGGDAITDAGCGGDQVDAEFALQPLLHDFHVQQPEEAAAESEAEGFGIFRLVEERGVVEPQLSMASRRILIGAGDSPGRGPRRPWI